MAYVVVEDFSHGLDQRKSALTAPNGSLRSLANAVVTAGGEIEKRKTFTALGSLTPGETFGVAFNGTNVVVFGTLAPGAISALPNYVSYEQLVPTDAATITRILDVQTFNGARYVIARFSDNSIRHYYNGTLVPSAQVVGTNVRAHKSKLYCVDGVNIRASAILDATDWTVGAGHMVTDVTTEDADVTDLVGLEQYYGLLALFARNSVQLWAMDPDPTKNSLVQVLGNIGLVAPNGVARYSNGDTLFLSDTGIRSLRARDASNSAVLNDVGSPVDAIIASRRAILTQAQAEKITALVDPLTGRYWLIWGDEVFVLSHYLNSKVTAWSRFALDTPVDYAAVCGSRVVIRQGDDLSFYGSSAGGNPFDPNTPTGVGNANFDATAVTVETPFMDAGTPATQKNWQGIDLTCEGTWEVWVNPDPTSASPKWIKVATVTGSTMNKDRIPLDMWSTHLAVKLVSTNTGIATVSRIMVHHSAGEAA